MALSITWGTKVINVVRTDMLLLQSVPTEIRQLNLDDFRLDLKDLEDDSDGMAFERTHKHNTSVTVGGVVLARVIEIINGYTVTFEDGQYAVNLVGANSNVADVVNVNQVSVRSANSAGLQDLSTLLSAAYQGRVVIDITDGQPGTVTPLGTFSTPVDNTLDALVIAENNGLRLLDYIQNTTILEDLSAGYELTAISPLVALIVGGAADVTNCSAVDVTLTGDLTGMVSITRSGFLTVDNVSGVINNCFFSSTVKLSGPTYIFESHSQLTGLGNVIFDIGVNNLVVRDFHGSLEFNNMTGGTHSIELAGGRVTLDSTCTGGTLYLRGEPFEIVDNSNGTVVVDQFDSLKVRELHGQAGRAIYINTEMIAVGNGYQQTPFNNFSDAIDEAEALEIRTLRITESATLDRQVKNFTIEGLGLPTIDLNGQNVDNTVFDLCVLGGSHTGFLQAKDGAIIGTLGNASGILLRFGIFGTITPAIGTGGLILWEIGTFAGDTPWTLDLSLPGGFHLVKLQNCVGSMIINNMTNAADNVTYNGLGGIVTIDATCTAGTININGSAKVIDNSAGTTVNISGTNQELVWATDKNTLVVSDSIGEHVAKKLLKFTQFVGLN